MEECIMGPSTPPTASILLNVVKINHTETSVLYEPPVKCSQTLPRLYLHSPTNPGAQYQNACVLIQDCITSIVSCTWFYTTCLQCCCRCSARSTTKGTKAGVLCTDDKGLGFDILLSWFRAVQVSYLGPRPVCSDNQSASENATILQMQSCKPITVTTSTACTACTAAATAGPLVYGQPRS
jgi:hypothetical protein